MWKMALVAVLTAAGVMVFDSQALAFGRRGGCSGGGGCSGYAAGGCYGGGYGGYRAYGGGAYDGRAVVTYPATRSYVMYPATRSYYVSSMSGGFYSGGAYRGTTTYPDGMVVK